MIRHTIVEFYKQGGTPLSLDEIATRTGKSVQTVSQELSTQPKLDELYGLSLTQAHELIEFYGSGVLFVEPITKAVSEAVSSRERLKRIESKKRSGGDVPPTSSPQSKD